MKISILGAGDFGTALGSILAEKGCDIDYYDSAFERERLSDVLSKAKFIVLCVPSKSVPHLLPYIPKNIPLIIATKGLLTDDYFKDFQDYMVLSGPGFAVDIKARKKVYLTATDQRVIDLFSLPTLQFDYTNDRRGVLMCGSLKNVYAILAGMKGLQRMSPEWYDFVHQANKEISKLLMNNSADSNTADLECGIGDLKLTCGMPSRNYEYGTILANRAGFEPENTVEGLTAARRIKRGEINVPEGLPLLTEVLSRLN